MDDVSLFSPEEREQIRAELVAAAKADARIGSAAHLGSAATSLQDRWSDIDLALGLIADVDLDQVVRDWTTRLYRDHAAAAHCDVRRGEILYRVFLLDNTLQMDFSFWLSGALRAIGPKFSLIFGTVANPVPATVPDSDELIGMAWLYALHVRSSIVRSRLLQAEHMLSGMRDNVFALACKRHGVASVQGRGLDDLPNEQRARAAECRARSLEPAELKRVFQITLQTLIQEVRCADPRHGGQAGAPTKLVANR
jgi:hypothetical protein